MNEELIDRVEETRRNLYGRPSMIEIVDLLTEVQRGLMVANAEIAALAPKPLLPVYLAKIYGNDWREFNATDFQKMVDEGMVTRTLFAAPHLDLHYGIDEYLAGGARAMGDEK